MNVINELTMGNVKQNMLEFENMVPVDLEGEITWAEISDYELPEDTRNEDEIAAEIVRDEINADHARS